jgi:hypothetical protein
LLYTIETLALPANTDYRIGLFFIDPWLVEEFCNYRRKFKNINVYLAENHVPENFNEHFGKYKIESVRIISDYQQIDQSLFFEMVLQ